MNHAENLSPLKRRRIRFQNKIFSNIKEAVAYPVIVSHPRYVHILGQKTDNHNRLPFSSIVNHELSRAYGVEMKRHSIATCMITYAAVSSLMMDDTSFACDVIRYGRDYEYITRVNDYLFGKVVKVHSNLRTTMVGFGVYGKVIRSISRIERGERFPFSSTDMPWKSIPEAVNIMKDWRTIGTEAATADLVDTRWFSMICAKLAYNYYSPLMDNTREIKF